MCQFFHGDTLVVVVSCGQASCTVASQAKFCNQILVTVWGNVPFLCVSQRANMSYNSAISMCVIYVCDQGQSAKSACSIQNQQTLQLLVTSCYKSCSKQNIHLVAEQKLLKMADLNEAYKRENTYYLSKSFIAFLVPAVEILSGIENKGLSSFYMSELAICG